MQSWIEVSVNKFLLKLQERDTWCEKRLSQHLFHQQEEREIQGQRVVTAVRRQQQQQPPQPSEGGVNFAQGTKQASATPIIHRQVAASEGPSFQFQLPSQQQLHVPSQQPSFQFQLPPQQQQQQLQGTPEQERYQAMAAYYRKFPRKTQRRIHRDARRPCRRSSSRFSLLTPTRVSFEPLSLVSRTGDV
jgi:hypothetical protein